MAPEVTQHAAVYVKQQHTQPNWQQTSIQGGIQLSIPDSNSQCNQDSDSYGKLNGFLAVNNVICGTQTIVMSQDRFHRIQNWFQTDESNGLFHWIWNWFHYESETGFT